jgi:hypothetical protein
MPALEKIALVSKKAPIQRVHGACRIRRRADPDNGIETQFRTRVRGNAQGEACPQRKPGHENPFIGLLA